MRALDAAMDALVAQGSDEEEEEEADGEEEADEEWRLLVRKSPCDLRCFTRKWSCLSPKLLGPDAESRASAVLCEPLVEAAAVLSSGALPRMKRLLRLRVDDAAPLCGHATWTLLLTDGPVGQIAGLIATVAKRLTVHVQYLEGRVDAIAPLPERQRRKPGEVEAAVTFDDIDQGYTAFPGVIKMATAFLSKVLFSQPLDALHHHQQQLATAAGTERVVGAGSAGAGGSGGGDSTRQLAALSSFVAVRLLPAVSRALRCLASPACQPITRRRSCVPSIVAALATTLRGSADLLSGLVPACNSPLAGAFAGEPGRDGAGTLAAAAEAAAVTPWRQLLLHDVDVLGLLAAATRLLTICSEPSGYNAGEARCGRALADALDLAAAAFPAELHAALRATTPSGGQPDPVPTPQHPQQPGRAAAAGARPAAAPGRGRERGSINGAASAAPGPSSGNTESSSGCTASVPRGGGGGSAGGGAGGADGGAGGGSGSAAAALSLGAITQLFGPKGRFPASEVLAKVTALAAAADAAAASAVIVIRQTAPTRLLLLLMPPDEARRRMAPHCCANTGCTNLEGPSEASLPRLRCGCGAGGGGGGDSSGGDGGSDSDVCVWWYCSEECRTTHGQEAHRGDPLA